MAHHQIASEYGPSFLWQKDRKNGALSSIRFIFKNNMEQRYSRCIHFLLIIVIVGRENLSIFYLNFQLQVPVTSSSLVSKYYPNHPLSRNIYLYVSIKATFEVSEV